MTASQAIETHAKYEFYWKIYKEELEIFREAFIARNDIYDPNGKSLKSHELTKEQLARMKRVQGMAESIKEASFRKQLK